MIRILCFGDSNTWGYIPGSDGGRYPADARWPGVLASRLGQDYQVIEEAQNGRTTIWDDPTEEINKNGSRHLPVVLESQMPIDLVIIMLGTNDLKNHFNQNAHAIAHGAGVLVDRVLASDAGPDNSAPAVLLISPAPVSDGHCPFGHLFDNAPARSRKFAEAYLEIAEEHGIPFLNAGQYASCPEPDCIHIDDTGHRTLGEAVAAKVRELLSRPE
jgi:lysophospholipase L1-like esterase